MNTHQLCVSRVDDQRGASEFNHRGQRNPGAARSRQENCYLQGQASCSAGEQRRRL